MRFKQFLESTEVDDLYFLIHDKGHILKPGKHSKTLDAKLATPNVSNKSLYRGLDTYNESDLQGLKVGDEFTTRSYWSASEKKSVAEGFAKGYKTGKVVELVSPVKGFNLWQWGVDDCDKFKKEDPKNYEDQDMAHIRSVYIQEAEWIVGIDVKFKIVEVKDDFPSKVKQL